MKSSKIIFVIMVIILIVVAFNVVVKINQYSGNEIFYAQDEYNQFMQTLIDTNAKWSNGKLIISSNTLPIIVEYTINVDKDIEFPYGEKLNESSYVYIWLGGSIILFYLIFMVNFEDALWLFRNKNYNDEQ